MADRPALLSRFTASQASPLVVDAVVAAAVLVVQEAGAAADAARRGQPDLTVLAVLLLAASALPLVFRRRHELVVLCSVGVITGLYGARNYPDPLLQLPLMIALYTVAARCPRRITVIVTLVGVVAALTSMVASTDSGVDDYYSTYLTLALALVLGDRQRIRTAQLGAVEDRADELQRRVVAEAERATAQERTRIAREMHDVVAHHVSITVVQAEAGAATADEATATRFDAIASTGRDALAELRRTLGVLRSEPDETTPQPGLDRVAALVAEVRDAGLAVELTVEGERGGVPPGIDLSAYRIVQEALTNVVRHARGAQATVAVRYRPTMLAVEVVDSGGATGGAGSSDGTGQGLVGIRERVAMCGGTMRSGPREGGGFAVSVELPLSSGSP